MSATQHTPGPKSVDVAEIAHQFGGFYESGAWRFPSPDRMQSFAIALQAAEDAAIAKATGSAS